MEKIYNKLVRDKIPQIIKAEGRIPVTTTCSNYKQALINKLYEEIEEFKQTSSPEELADIYEILLWLSKECNTSIRKVMQIARKKRKHRGGFSRKIFLIKVKGL